MKNDYYDNCATFSRRTFWESGKTPLFFVLVNNEFTTSRDFVHIKQRREKYEQYEIVNFIVEKAANLEMKR